MELLGGSQHAEAILSDFDVDGDRKIDFEEFKALILSGGGSASASASGASGGGRAEK